MPFEEISCVCDCHGRGAYGACSIEGGCGHLHQDRRCASGSSCARREKQTEKDATGSSRTRWAGALLRQAEGLCPACLTRVGWTIGYLALDVVELGMLIGATGSGGDEIVSSTRDLPVPIRLGIDALRNEIDFELQYWAETVAAATSVDWDSEKAERSRLAIRVKRASDFLALRVDALVALGPQERSAWSPEGEPLRDRWGDREVEEMTGLEGALRLVDLHHRVRRAAGRTTLVHRLTPACPWCDQRTLVRHNGSDMVECENCRKTIEEKHYNWFVEITIREEKRRQAAA